MKNRAVFAFLLSFAAFASAAQSPKVFSSLRDFLHTDNLYKGEVVLPARNVTYKNAAVEVFSSVEETKGTHYLLSEWSSGELINRHNQALKSDKARYNYDKVKKQLLVTEDFKTAVELNQDGLLGFTIGTAPAFAFERAPAIGDDFYVSIAGAAGGFRAFKALKTQYQKANYQTDGLVESGNDYSEYVDQPLYYILSADSSKAVLIDPKKRLPKEAFPNNPNATQFIRQHRFDAVDDRLVTDLTEALNK